MGIPYWGSDIGGYSEFADREVFARWIEVGALSPIMRVHGKGSRRSVGHADRTALRP